MRNRLWSLSIIAAIIISVCGFMSANEVKAAPEPNSGKAFVIVVDKLVIDDITKENTPGMMKIIEDGSIGLASNRTLRGHNSFDAYLTMGSGNLARAYDNGILGFNADEIVPGREMEARNLYSALTGQQAFDKGCVLVNLPELALNMETEKVNTHLGVLGTILKEEGYRTCVLGNADLPADQARYAVVFAMDDKGRVPLGDVGKGTNAEPVNSYLGRCTDYDYLKKHFTNYRQQSDLIVVDLGDLQRLDRADLAFPDQALSERSLRLKQIDDFISYVCEQMDQSKDLLYVVSPSTTKLQINQKNYFTPIIAYGKGYTHGGLSSGATRRDYVIANTDVAPGILAFFGLQDKQGYMIGQKPVTMKTDEAALTSVRDLSMKAGQVNRLRSPLITGYVIGIIIIILLTLMGVFMTHKHYRFYKILMIPLVVVPLVFLFLGRLNFALDWLYILVAILATVLITWLLWRLFKGDAMKIFLFLAVVTALLIDIDVLTGTRMIQSSVLGYDPMAGARYYGIGNEYMGILIGCSIIAVAGIYQKYRQRWMLIPIALFLAFQCYLIGAPHLGAQSDGVITAPIAFLITLFLLADIRIKPRTLFIIVLVMILAVLGVTYIDLQRPLEQQSHIGRAAGQILAGGPQQGLMIILRKLGMNVKLIRYTIWSRVLIAILLVSTVLVYRPVGALRELAKRVPYLMKGFTGVIAAALVGLVMNDSGIVAASTTSIFLVTPLLLLMLDLRQEGMM